MSAFSRLICLMFVIGRQFSVALSIVLLLEIAAAITAFVLRSEVDYLRLYYTNQFLLYCRQFSLMVNW